MNKVIAIIILTTAFTLSFVGCSSSPKTDTSTPKAPVVQKKAEVTIKVRTGTKDTGKGTIEIVTPSGNSKTGVVPFLYADKDTSLIQLGFNAWGFNGAKLSYIFVDGILNTKEQLGDEQTALNLSGDDLKVGTHKVEVTQYDNDKIDGKIITYKLGRYEIRSK